jgi:hypothetical protein
LDKELIELIDVYLVLRVCQDIDGVSDIYDLVTGVLRYGGGNGLEVGLVLAVSVVLISRLYTGVA